MKILRTVSGVGLVVVIVGFGVALWTNFRPAAKIPPLKIGVMGPLTGPDSSSGLGPLRGAELAKRQLNATSIEFVTVDTQCDDTLSPAGMKKLIAQGVVAVIGETCSAASLAAVPFANESKVPMVSAVSSSPKLSVPNDFFFRVVPPDTRQGSFTASYLREQGLKSAAIFFSDEAYGKDLGAVFGEQFRANGGTIVGQYAFKLNALDFAAEVQAVKQSKPAAIYIASNSLISSGALIRQLRDAGVEARLFGSDALNDQVLISDAGASAEGLIATAFPTGSDVFKAQMRAQYGAPAEALYGAPQGYDAFTAIYRAIEGGARTGAQIKDALTSMKFKGISGQIEFDSNGEMSGSFNYELRQVTRGKFVLLK